MQTVEDSQKSGAPESAPGALVTNQAVQSVEGAAIGGASLTGAPNVHLSQQGLNPVFLVFAFFLGGLALWCSFDHTTATWDGAGHALRGYQCADILRSHACLTHKLHEMVTVTSFYPPFTYISHGFLHLALGDGEWVDGLARFLWYALAGFALYKTTMLAFRDRATAALAAAVFYFYPGTYGVTHAILLLDIPLTAMIFSSMWRLGQWYEKPSWTSALLVGFALGLTFLTKHTALLFFAVPLVILFGQACMRRNWVRAAQLVAVGVLSFACFLCWLLPNLQAFRHFVSSNQSLLTNHSLIGLWCENFSQYFVLASTAMSPLGLAAFIAALLYIPGHKKLWLVGATAGGALVLHVVLNWIPQFRYLLPATAFTAALTAAAIMALWRSRAWWGRAAIVAAACYALFMYVELNFSPWPLAVSANLEPVTGLSWIRSNYPVGIKSEPMSPTPPCDDWGYDWVLKTIAATDGRTASTMCVLPDLAELNTPGFMYYTRVKHSAVQLTTYRLWSMAGYDFVFTDEQLRWVRWYVVLRNSTQKEGREFATSQAAARYKQLLNLLDSDPTFVLVGTKTIPGGGELMLYRNRKTDPSPVPH